MMGKVVSCTLYMDTTILHILVLYVRPDSTNHPMLVTSCFGIHAEMVGNSWNLIYCYQD